MKNESVKRFIISLERTMGHCGNDIQRKERIIKKFPKSPGAAKMRQDIERLEAKQDEINSRLARILSKFDVEYSGKGYYTCTNAEGSFTIRQTDCEVVL
jgi:hypothetical protein